MKVVILAGGRGTRLSEETGTIPKPMVEIGGRPILWHIMKIYSYWGYNDFIILTGYLSHVIKNYFLNYYTRYSDITIDMQTDAVQIHHHRTEPWKVTMLYTELNTMTGGRLLRAKDYIGAERFMLSYGDGVADIDIPELLENHEKAGKHVTLTAVRPVGRFGTLEINNEGAVADFAEKIENQNTWVNGGFFVMEPKIFEYLNRGDKTVLEREPLETLAAKGQLNAYRHEGFWKAMDTLRDKNELTALWNSHNAPWARWREKNDV
jgi:glucose-1-phosphate cytidylyltransferase